MIDESDVAVGLLFTFTAVIRVLVWLVVEVEIVAVADERIDCISARACSCGKKCPEIKPNVVSQHPLPILSQDPQQTFVLYAPGFLL